MKERLLTKMHTYEFREEELLGRGYQLWGAYLLLLERQNGDNGLTFLYIKAGKKGVVIFPHLLMTNFEPFNHDLTIERGIQQGTCCIYCGVRDSEALGTGHSLLKRRAHVGTYLQVCPCQQLLLAKTSLSWSGTKNEVLWGYCKDEDAPWTLGTSTSYVRCIKLKH